MQKRTSSHATVLLALLALVGSACTRTTAPLPLGSLIPDPETVAVMRLRPDAAATTCRRWFAGVLLDADPDDPVQRLLATEREANVLGEGTVQVEEFSVGPYVRQCVTIRGVLARTIRSITIPAGEAHHHHHH